MRSPTPKFNDIVRKNILEDFGRMLVKYGMRVIRCDTYYNVRLLEPAVSLLKKYKKKNNIESKLFAKDSTLSNYFEFLKWDNGYFKLVKDILCVF